MTSDHLDRDTGRYPVAVPLRRTVRRAGLLVARLSGAPRGRRRARSSPRRTPPATRRCRRRPAGRRWLVPIPAGCDVPDLPDVVFVGTLVETGTPAGAPDETAYQTARFRLDQARAGDIGRFSYNGFVDVRYGLDAKDLTNGRAVPGRRERRSDRRRPGLDDPPARAVLRR